MKLILFSLLHLLLLVASQDAFSADAAGTCDVEELSKISARRHHSGEPGIPGMKSSADVGKADAKIEALAHSSAPVESALTRSGLNPELEGDLTRLRGEIHSGVGEAAAHEPAPAKAVAAASVAHETTYARAEERYAHATEILNQRLAERFHGPENWIARDPDGFVAEMDSRFARQKALTPEHPYRFDYSEIGNPLVKDMSEQLTTKIAKLTELRDAAEAKWLGKRNVKELNTALAYLGDLQKDMKSHLAAGKITYEDLYNSSYFFARAYGHFDAREMNLIEKFYLKTDQIINGYKQLSIDKEYELYKTERSMVFQNHSRFGGLAESESRFGKDIFDPEKLNLIIVPSNASLDRDIFNRLLRTKIYFAGVTDNPIRADGILRPSGDFWNHDLRHSTVMYQAYRKYVEALNLTAEQMKALNKQIDRWYLEVHDAMQKIEDPKLREAVDLYFFNHHHERGFPIVPSSFKSANQSVLPYVLYTMMETDKQKNSFSIVYMRKAENWLKDYWGARLDQEKPFLDAHLTNVIAAPVPASSFAANERPVYARGLAVKEGGNVGVFADSFDPPREGQRSAILGSLDKGKLDEVYVYVKPSAAGESLSFEERKKMAELAFSGNPRVKFLDSSAFPGNSYPQVMETLAAKNPRGLVTSVSTGEAIAEEHFGRLKGANIRYLVAGGSDDNSMLSEAIRARFAARPGYVQQIDVADTPAANLRRALARGDDPKAVPGLPESVANYLSDQKTPQQSHAGQFMPGSAAVPPTAVHRGTPVYSKQAFADLQRQDPAMAAALRYREAGTEELARARASYFSGETSMSELDRVNALYGKLESPVMGGSESSRRLGYLKQQENYLARKAAQATIDQDLKLAKQLDASHAAVSAQLAGEVQSHSSVVAHVGETSRKNFVDSLASPAFFGPYQDHFPGRSLSQVMSDPGEAALFQSLVARSAAQDTAALKEASASVSSALLAHVTEGAEADKAARAQKMADDLGAAHAMLTSETGATETKTALEQALHAKGWSASEVKSCQETGICDPWRAAPAKEELFLSPTARAALFEDAAAKTGDGTNAQARSLAALPATNASADVAKLKLTQKEVAAESDALTHQAGIKVTDGALRQAADDAKKAESALSERMAKLEEKAAATPEPKPAMKSGPRVDALAEKKKVDSETKELLARAMPKGRAPASLSKPDFSAEAETSLRGVKALSEADRTALVKSLGNVAARDSAAAARALTHLTSLAANPDMFETFRLAYVRAVESGEKDWNKAWEGGVKRMLSESGYEAGEIEKTVNVETGLKFYQQTARCLAM